MHSSRLCFKSLSLSLSLIRDVRCRSIVYSNYPNVALFQKGVAMNCFKKGKQRYCFNKSEEKNIALDGTGKEFRAVIESETRRSEKRDFQRKIDQSTSEKKDTWKKNVFARRTRSLLTESFAFFDGKEQFFFQYFVFLIRREIEPIETSMRTRENILFAVLFYTKFLRSIGT